MIIAIITIFIIHLLLGVPLFISLLLASIVGFTFIDFELAFRIIPQQFFSGIDSFSLMAIPLFILAGNLLNESGLTPRLMNFSRSLVGHLKGGLGYVNVISSVFFAGVNGSAIADTTALGTMLVPAMKKEGYSTGYAASLTAGSSLIGPIIPPSIFMILYASLTNSSVGDLFLAGIIPGLLLGLCFFFVNWNYARKNNLPVNDKRESLPSVINAFLYATPALFAPILIVMSIIFGIVTPTESGALIVLYSLVIGVLLRTLSLKLIVKAIIDATKLTSAIFLIIAASSVITWVLGYAQVPTLFTHLLTPFIDNPVLILFILSLITFFIGMLMEEVSALMLLTPIFMPVALQAGIDPIHLGIVITMNITIALITPPMGACLYVASAVSKLELSRLFIEIIPFIGYALSILTLIIFIPQLTLFFPGLFN
ncbi:TRAP transporter large permease [Photobacterium sp. ZSDE20]|uniref:TRAP transporter large permease protein n=1 Tax=Photobacterium pectinilyticum TaxID=2906793 RepID=A0ABT1N1Q7_9GAMM|nr:TRAP transporter large permease [Photobacterium sp. ZSDE20]MCQ1058666.1 TRAP transporter large permease [Photobacterium sp. ZSDE20]MDD1823380.1 TRAP transporter large permease [Photobacterium sp. ZSDE20]